MKLDCFARQKHYIDHMAPIWREMDPERRGVFYAPEKIMDYAVRELGRDGIIEFNENTPPGAGPILVAAYGDMHSAARNPERVIINMEHGTGHAFGTAAYPDGKGKRDLVDLFLMPNEYTLRIAQPVRPNARYAVIGTPKMDEVVYAARRVKLQDPPVIAVGFHWGDRNASPPESGNAWEHYKDILPELAKRYRVIGYGHPLSVHVFEPAFREMGIDFVEDFREVMRWADVCINDLSSVMYEFIVTGKPVVVLNAPWFRRDKHFGIRFWDYSDIGINVEGPDELFPAIDRTLTEYTTIHLPERRRAVRDLYPYLGMSAHRAVQVLTGYLEELEIKSPAHSGAV